MSDFDRALAFVLKWEGGYSDTLNDRGGPTNSGVTQVVYDEYHDLLRLPHLPVTEILPGEIEDLYRRLYWERLSLDSVPWPLSVTLFDMGVNQGVARAATARGAVRDLIPDGAVAQARAVLGLRLYLYRRTALTEKGQSGFLRGWENRVMDLATVVG